MSADKVLYECPACGARLKGKPEMEGREAPCPACKKVIAEWPAPIEDDGKEPDEVWLHPIARRKPEEPVPAGLLIACVSTTAAAAACVAMPFIWACGAPLAAFAFASCLIVSSRYRASSGVAICAVLAVVIGIGSVARGVQVNEELRKLARELKD